MEKFFPCSAENGSHFISKYFNYLYSIFFANVPIVFGTISLNWCRHHRYHHSPSYFTFNDVQRFGTVRKLTLGFNTLHLLNSKSMCSKALNSQYYDYVKDFDTKVVIDHQQNYLPLHICYQGKPHLKNLCQRRSPHVCERLAHLTLPLNVKNL